MAFSLQNEDTILENLSSPVTTNLDIVPVRPAGSFMYNELTNEFYVSSGTAWVLINGGGGGALPASLQSIAGLTTTGNEIIYTTSSDVYATTPAPVLGRNIIGSSTQNDAQTILGTRVGTDVQGFSAGLQSFSTTSAGATANQMPYYTGSNAVSSTNLTLVGRNFLAANTIQDQRDLLEVIEKANVTTNNAIVRWVGAVGDEVSDSGVIIDDTDNITGVANITSTGNVQSVNVNATTQVDTPAILNSGGDLSVEGTTITSAQWPRVANMQDVSLNADITLGTLSLSDTVTGASPGNTATTKTYVDTVAATGAAPLDRADYATDAILPNAPNYASPAETLTSTAGGGVQLVVDGELVNAGERILVKDQADPKQNGVYDVTADGTGVAWQLTRSSDFNQAAMPALAGSSIFINFDGPATNAGSTWSLQTTVNDVDPLTDDVDFVQIGGSPTFTAGDGIDVAQLAGGTIELNTNADFTFAAGQLQLASPIPVNKGGTGNVTLTNGNVLLGAGAGSITSAKAAPAGDFVGTSDLQTLTNKTLDNTNNDIRAIKLGTSGAGGDPVTINGSVPGGLGQALLINNANPGTYSAQWGNVSIAYQNNIIVAKSGGDYTSIVAAINAINGGTGPAHAPGPPATGNRMVITVYPGVYSEVNPIIVPSYVALQSVENLRGPAPVVQVNPITITSPIFQLSNFCCVTGLLASGANGAGGRGFSAPNGIFACQLQECMVENCEIGFESVGDGTFQSSTMFLVLCVARATPAATLTTAFQATNGGNITSVSCTVAARAPATPIVNGFYATGNFSRVVARVTQITRCDNAFRCAGAGGDTAEMFITSGDIVDSVTNALLIEADAAIEMFGVNVTNSGVFDLNLTSATSAFIGAGNKLREDLTNLGNPNAQISSASISTRPGENSFSILGELHVGDILNPSESSFGGGDSTVNGMSVVRFDHVAVTFTDITTDVILENDGNNAPAFVQGTVDGGGTGDAIYVGNVLDIFFGIKINIINQGILPAGGNSAITAPPVYVVKWQYWDGAAWTNFRIISTDSDEPYRPNAMESFDLGNFQYRFGAVAGGEQPFTVGGTFISSTNQYVTSANPPANWAQTIINGINGYWVRAILSGPPSTTVVNSNSLT